MPTLDEVLAHHGIKGMRWGVRRRTGSDGRVSGGSSHETSSDAARATDYHTRARSSGTHTLSNQELRHLTDRMTLEMRYSEMTAKQAPKSKLKTGGKFAGEFVAQVGKQQAQRAANDYVAKQIALAMKRKATGG